MLRLSRIVEPDDTLWNRKPTYLGTYRRTEYNQPAKDTHDNARLWTTIQELAARSQVPWEGALVCGGIKNFRPATGPPGTLWLLVWPWKKPTAVQTYELKSHWTVRLDGITPDWEDSAFVGVYSTQEYSEGWAQKEASQPKVDTRDALPSIKEESRKPSDPINAFERGVWLPDEPKPSPNDWVPILDPIPEGTDEDSSESFRSLEELPDNEELLADYMVNEQSGGSSASNSRPQKVLWVSRGPEVFITEDPSKDSDSRRNNQVLTKAEEQQFSDLVSEAKLKGLDNYCAHRAIQGVMAKGH